MSSSQDYELLFRLLKVGASFGYDGTMNTRVFKRESGSISQTGKLENWRRYLELRVDIRNHLKGQNRDYVQEIQVLDQYLFAAIRALSEYDLNIALHEYDRLIPKGFKPAESQAISKRYINLFSIFGFRLAERLIRFAKPLATRIV